MADALLIPGVGVVESGSEALLLPGGVVVEWPSASGSYSPVVGGGGSGKAYSSKRLRKDVDDWLERERLRELAEQIRREDEELVVILTALAA